MNKLQNRKALLTGGVKILAIITFMVSLMFLGSSAQTVPASQAPNQPSQTGTVPLSTEQDESEPPGSDTNEDDSGVDMRINDTRMRWNGEHWEYSTDGGQTWSDTPPDGVHVDDEGNMNVWQGEGDYEDFDVDAYLQEVEDMVDSIISDIDDRYGDLIPEYAEDGSFFTYGDTIARQVDGVWEFSADGGETWTTDPPEGFEMSEDGTRFRIGGGEGDINDFDAEKWLEEWHSQWGDSYENRSGEDNANTLGAGQNIAV